MEMEIEKGKYGLQKGDKFFARPACPRDENTGQILFIPDRFEKPLTVTKVFSHGVRSNRGYIHNNCIISKIELPESVIDMSPAQLNKIDTFQNKNRGFKEDKNERRRNY